MSEHLESFLNSIGLGFFKEFKYDMRVDRTMVNILIQFYDRGKKCFIFNGIHRHFSLIDVHILTGMRVDGMPVMSRIVADPKILFTHAFDMEPPLSGAFDGGKIRLACLRATYSDLVVAPSDPGWLPYLRAYFFVRHRVLFNTRWHDGCCVCPVFESIGRHGCRWWICLGCSRMGQFI